MKWRRNWMWNRNHLLAWLKKSSSSSWQSYLPLTYRVYCSYCVYLCVSLTLSLFCVYVCVSCESFPLLVSLATQLNSPGNIHLTQQTCITCLPCVFLCLCKVSHFILAKLLPFLFYSYLEEESFTHTSLSLLPLTLTTGSITTNGSTYAPWISPLCKV